MTRQTQYERITAFLQGKDAASYLELQTKCRTTCPWKRLQEMRQRGWIFATWQEPWNGRQITKVALVSSPK